MSTSAPGSSAGRLLQIGEVADRVGLSLRTVRYYEEMELLIPASRTEGGFRLYTDEQVHRLELIKQMKPLGFSVQEMRELLEARDAASSLETPERAAQEAKAVLARFAADAARRCGKLRGQLDAGEAVTAQLRREAR
ncbi:MAG: MerR family transcriptional regulator [Solirubrobacteraceae bacterium]